MLLFLLCTAWKRGLPGKLAVLSCFVQLKSILLISFVLDLFTAGRSHTAGLICFPGCWQEEGPVGCLSIWPGIHCLPGVFLLEGCESLPGRLGCSLDQHWPLWSWWKEWRLNAYCASLFSNITDIEPTNTAVWHILCVCVCVCVCVCLCLHAYINLRMSFCHCVCLCAHTCVRAHTLESLPSNILCPFSEFLSFCCSPPGRKNNNNCFANLN